MALIDLFNASFFEAIEKEVLVSVGVSLSRNKKVVTARTIKSVRAVTIFKENSVEFEAYGAEGMPHIIQGKPANTKYPLDYKGTKENKSGKQIKVFELKPHLKDWKAIVGFGGSDFILARSIAKNARAPIDIASEAINYLSEKVPSMILKQFGKLLAVEIKSNFENSQDNV